jgi:hypothetical protein
VKIPRAIQTESRLFWEDPAVTSLARFRFWFVSEVPGFRAIAIAQAPAAFRRRGVFIPERSLHRV